MGYCWIAFILADHVWEWEEMMATLCAIFSVCGGVFYAEAYFLVDRNLFLFHKQATLNGEQRGGKRPVPSDGAQPKRAVWVHLLKLNFPQCLYFPQISIGP